ncbi:ABC transporter substrate-binding protein [Dethiosulfovibrio sp. F2B]|uniref:ABC transporter substrate-binding protein n=1 Tax=Dethiosulfovibrio faecalis TaxID=2720018 RepID=UPI001F3C5309|nr:ABC transporter substrate-binding protein [Dethiosulfovibrio faecalis]
MRRTILSIFAVSLLVQLAAGAAFATDSRRVVVDQTGTEVSIPEKVERVVITSPWPLPSVYVLFHGSADKLIGMHPASLSAAKYSLLPRIAPEVVEVDSSFIKNGEINVEELLKMRPDVVLYNASNLRNKAIFEKAGIPAVAFSTSVEKFNVMNTLNSWVKLLGEVFQKEDSVKEIVDYGRQTYDAIQSRLAGLAEEDKPRVLILFHYSETQFMTSGSNFYGQYWCDASGAVNVASELRGMTDINMEQVYEWNPDIIYITNFSSFMPEDLYENKALPNHDWSGVKAVREGRVYKFPLGIYRWFPPSGDSPLNLKFLAKHNHPELFEDMDLDKEVRDYYRRFYHMDLSDEEVDRIFHPVREAAGGV